MRTRAILALAVTLIGLALVGPAAAAAAAPVAYPPTICPTLSVSTTTPLVGEQIIVTGTNFTPKAHISLELHTKTYLLGTVVSNAAGGFTTTVTMPPGVTGTHLIFAVGGGFDTMQCPAEPLQIGVQPGPTSTSATPGPTPPAVTGFDILALIVGAAVLLAAGALVNRSGQRHRPAHRA